VRPSADGQLVEGPERPLCVLPLPAAVPVNISKATLERAFVDELALLQPTPGYMRLVKDRILLRVGQRRAEAKDERRNSNGG
jgi:hypothetical protein